MVCISVPSISGWARLLPCFCVRQSPSAAAPALMDASALCRHRNWPGAEIYCFWEGRGAGWAPSKAGLHLPRAAPPAALGAGMRGAQPNSSSSELAVPHPEVFTVMWVPCHTGVWTGILLVCPGVLFSGLINHRWDLTKSSLEICGTTRIRFEGQVF